MNYYGDKISDNMALTPESFLICSNVPIGRTGWMDYLGQEIPVAFGETTGTWVQVYRSPEELFSPATIASFEGKSVTNTHPTTLLDINSASMIERGHAQNVRRNGDFLVADLFIKDAGLISEVQNNIKREVSSGYNCSWHKIGEGKYEQKEITGNHVAVVQSGRAGHEVAIMDAAPPNEPEKPNELSAPSESSAPNELEKPKTGGKKMKFTSIKDILGLGLKHFAADAEPEDIAKAMDAIEEESKKEVKDAEPEDKKDPEDKKKEPAQDAMPAWAQQLVTDMQALRAEVKDSKPEDKETAESVMDATEEELEKEAKDGEPEEKKEPTKDAAPASVPPQTGGAADAALKKFVADMKPIIMAIPDEKTRLEAAKKFRATVHDARSSRATNGYGAILGAVDKNKHFAMDSVNVQAQSVTERAEASAKAWNAQGDKMKGGK